MKITKVARKDVELGDVYSDVLDGRVRLVDSGVLSAFVVKLGGKYERLRSVALILPPGFKWVSSMTGLGLPEVSRSPYHSWVASLSRDGELEAEAKKLFSPSMREKKSIKDLLFHGIDPYRQDAKYGFEWGQAVTGIFPSDELLEVYLECLNTRLADLGEFLILPPRPISAESEKWKFLFYGKWAASSDASERSALRIRTVQWADEIVHQDKADFLDEYQQVDADDLVNANTMSIYWGHEANLKKDPNEELWALAIAQLGLINKLKWPVFYPYINDTLSLMAQWEAKYPTARFPKGLGSELMRQYLELCESHYRCVTHSPWADVSFLCRKRH